MLESHSDSENEGNFVGNRVRDRSPNEIRRARVIIDEFLNDNIVLENPELENLMMAEQNLQSFHLQTIPKFDGERTTLPVFLKNCEAFISTYIDNANPANPRNAWILRSILSRLEGRAMALVGSREDANSWFNIKRLLLQYFSDQRSLDCLLRELMYLKRDPRESLHEYGIKIQDVHNQLSTKLRLSDLDENLKIVKERDYENVALSTYLHGLPEQLSLAIRIQKPENVPQAMSMVQNEENLTALNRDSRSHASGSKPHNYNNTKHKNFPRYHNNYENYGNNFTPFRNEQFHFNNAPRPNFNNYAPRPFNNFSNSNNFQQNFSRPRSMNNYGSSRQNNFQRHDNTYQPTPMETSTRNMTRITQRPTNYVHNQQFRRNYERQPRRQTYENSNNDIDNLSENFCRDLNLRGET